MQCGSDMKDGFPPTRESISQTRGEIQAGDVFPNFVISEKKYSLRVNLKPLFSQDTTRKLECDVCLDQGLQTYIQNPYALDIAL